ncbi:unnamed protein product, partial [Iphiclides podalirius]
MAANWSTCAAALVVTCTPPDLRDVTSAHQDRRLRSVGNRADTRGFNMAAPLGGIFSRANRCGGAERETKMAHLGRGVGRDPFAGKNTP